MSVFSTKVFLARPVSADSTLCTKVLLALHVFC
jgi:hypothetical protein